MPVQSASILAMLQDENQMRMLLAWSIAQRTNREVKLLSRSSMSHAQLIINSKQRLLEKYGDDIYLISSQLSQFQNIPAAFDSLCKNILRDTKSFDQILWEAKILMLMVFNGDPQDGGCPRHVGKIC